MVTARALIRAGASLDDVGDGDMTVWDLCPNECRDTLLMAQYASVSSSMRNAIVDWTAAGPFVSALAREFAQKPQHPSKCNALAAFLSARRHNFGREATRPLLLLAKRMCYVVASDATVGFASEMLVWHCTSSMDDTAADLACDVIEMLGYAARRGIHKAVEMLHLHMVPPETYVSLDPKNSGMSAGMVWAYLLDHPAYSLPAMRMVAATTGEGRVVAVAKMIADVFGELPDSLASPCEVAAGRWRQRLCAHQFCGAPALRPRTGPFKMCPGCEVARYCGPECQRLDWPFHKPYCVQQPAFKALKARKAV